MLEWKSAFSHISTGSIITKNTSHYYCLQVSMLKNKIPLIWQTIASNKKE